MHRTFVALVATTYSNLSTLRTVQVLAATLNLFKQTFLMSNHATTTLADNAVRKPGFMDLFAVHFAARLVGREYMLKCFDEASSDISTTRSSSSRVYTYWRTPLLHDIHPDSFLSAAADSETTQESNDWNMLFVDVTVEGNQSQRRINTTIGMLLQRDVECLYVTAKPLVYSQLASHCESVGIDIECTAPDAIAHTMGTALMSLVGSTVKLERTNGLFDHSGKLPVLLYYKELQERGSLEIFIDTVQDYNQRGAAMLISNVANQDKMNSEASATNDEDLLVHDTQLASELTKSFETWWNTPVNPIAKEGAAQSAVESEAPGSTVEEVSKPPASHGQSSVENVPNGAGLSSAAPENIPTEPSTTVASTSSLPAVSAAPSDTTNVPEKKKEEETTKPTTTQAKRPQAGYVRANAKRKRGKLTFAKAK